MRIHAMSASHAVRRSLEAVIVASGHQATGTDEAEMLLIDPLHPQPVPLGTYPQLVLEPALLAHPIRPFQLKRLLVARGAATLLPLGQGWQLDMAGRSLTHPAAASLSLTEKEAQLLSVLACATPTALPREKLLEEVWGLAREIDTHTLETHIYRLRHKLGSLIPPACDIINESGAYKLVGAAA